MDQATRREFLAVAAGTLTLAALPAADPAAPKAAAFEPVTIPDWVHSVTRMAFATPGEVARVAEAGAQVLHTNVVWPYYPLRRDGGGLNKEDARRLRELADDCRKHHLRLVLGLPPFPPATLVTDHPDWRVHPDDSGAVLKLPAKDDDLGTRLCCNLGPWGAYLIDVCAELTQDYGLDGYSFDGNYHPPICYCPACKKAYQADAGKALPPRVDLDEVAYREYLVWRGRQLEAHYRQMQERLKKQNPDLVLMSWTVNAGRYGQLLQSPRSMTTRLNLLFDLPMQEWWLDETNQGNSVAPAFGAAYLRGTVGGRPNASEPYLMSHGNPYGSDSFPRHEFLTRVLLALTNGSRTAASFGWPGHADSTREIFAEVKRRSRWLTDTKPLPWAALLVGEQTRQFHAYKDIAERYLPHLFGTFRAALEEHLPLDLVNDWDVTAQGLAPYRVVVLPNAAALSDAQAAALRTYVQGGGGLVATVDSSLFDELGRPRADFALADLFGVSFQGRPPHAKGPENFWKQRSGVARLSWDKHPLVDDAGLRQLVPQNTAVFRGPLVQVAAPEDADTVAVRMVPDGWKGEPLAAVVARRVGQGRVVYLAAGLDAALWSYAYPYQRRLLARALAWAASEPPPFRVTAPMCVQTTFFSQSDRDGRRLVIHLFNGLNTTAGHGLATMDVPLREETVAVHGIRIRFEKDGPVRFHVEPGGALPAVRRDGTATVVELPPLEIHAMLVGEY